MSNIIWGGLWTLIGLLVVITGQLSYEGLWDWSKRQARIIGAVVVFFGLSLVSNGVLEETGWFASTRIALNLFYVFFVVGTVLFVVIAAVKITRWSKAGGGR